MCNSPCNRARTAEGKVAEEQKCWVVVQNTFVNVVDGSSSVADWPTSLRPSRSDSFLCGQGAEGRMPGIPLNLADIDSSNFDLSGLDGCSSPGVESPLSSFSHQRKHSGSSLESATTADVWPTSGESRNGRESGGEEEDHATTIDVDDRLGMPSETPAENKQGMEVVSSLDVDFMARENARLASENAALLETVRLMQGLPGTVRMPEQQGFACMPNHCGGSMWVPFEYMMCTDFTSGSELNAGSGMARRDAETTEVKGSRPRKSGSTSKSISDITCEVPEAERTTVMLRNLPNNYTRAMLMELLASEGFGGDFDFLYFPIDFRTKAALGYAFVNCVDPAAVQRFWRAFDGFSNWMLPSKKVCYVSWCEPNQGLQAHIERYRNSPVMHTSVPDEYKPVLLENGHRVPFPKSTKATRAPRVRDCRRDCNH
jgi:hypothetical protein